MSGPSGCCLITPLMQVARVLVLLNNTQWARSALRPKTEKRTMAEVQMFALRCWNVAVTWGGRRSFCFFFFVFFFSLCAFSVQQPGLAVFRPAVSSVVASLNYLLRALNQAKPFHNESFPSFLGRESCHCQTQKFEGKELGP